MRPLLALGLALFLAAPFVPLLIWSVARGWFFPEMLPQVWHLDAWSRILSPGSGVPQAVWTTTWVAALTTGLSLLVGLPAAMALGRGFRGARAVELLLLAPVIVPGIAVVFGLHGLFLRLGLANTATGVVLAHLIPTLPYMVLVLAGVVRNLDPDLARQARSLGASAPRAFVSVTLPALAPGVMVGALFAFLVSWSQYLVTLVIGGGKVVTLPLLLFATASAGRNDLTAAMALVYVAPGLVIVALVARQVTGRSAALAGPRP